MNPTETGSIAPLLLHAGWLRRLARSLVLDDGEADDLVQETWLAALRGGAEAARHPRAWLAGSLRHLARGQRRGEGRRKGHEALRARDMGAVHGAAADAGAQTLERERALLDLLDALPPAQRSVLVARYYEGLAPRAIARQSGASVETVKSQLKRGLAALRERLDARHGDREAWATWLLPLAAQPRGVAAAAVAPGLAVGVALVAAAAVVIGSAVALNGARADRAQHATLQRTTDVAASSPDRGGSALELPNAPDAQRAAAPLAGPVTVIRVLAGPAGAPVAGAQVAVLTDAMVEALVERSERVLSDAEQLFIDHDHWLTTDARGEVRVTEPGDWAVCAATSRGVAMQRCAAGAGPHVLELTPACRIDVRVVDAAGEPLAGVPVVGDLTVRGTGRNGDDSDADVHSCERVTDATGTWFQQPFGMPTSAETRPVWTEFRIDLPGVSETGARGRVGTQYASAGPGARPATVELSLPETAPLALEIVAPEGERAQLDGVVACEVRAQQHDSGLRYDAALVDGRAEWPRVALGLEVELRIRIPTLGSEWTVRGAGPTRVGEATVLRTTRPDRPVLRGRLVDGEARPQAGVTVATSYRRRDQKFVTFGPRAETGADGVFRFEWALPEDLVPPLYLHAEQRSLRGVREDALAVALDGARSGATLELGDLRVDLAVQPPLRVRCVDEEGAPVAGLMVTATQVFGLGFGGETDARGRVELRGVFAESVPLSVWDPEERFPRVELELANPNAQEPASNEPVDVVMRRGATLSGHIERPAFFEPAHEVHLFLRRVGDDATHGARVEPGGDFEATGLAPGRWNLEVRVGISGTVARIEGIEVTAGARVRDERIDRVRLDTLVRPVRVIAQPTPSRARVQAQVYGPQGRFHMTTRGEALLVPTQGVWSARFFASGRRTHIVEDAHSLGDEVEVDLASPVRVSLRLLGARPPGKGLELRGVAGTATAQELWQLPRNAGADGVLQAYAPLAGRYRLALRTEREEGNGVSSISAEPTHIELEVPDGEGPFELTLDLTSLAPE